MAACGTTLRASLFGLHRGSTRQWKVVMFGGGLGLRMPGFKFQPCWCWPNVQTQLSMCPEDELSLLGEQAQHSAASPKCSGASDALMDYGFIGSNKMEVPREQGGPCSILTSSVARILCLSREGLQ